MRSYTCTVILSVTALLLSGCGKEAPTELVTPTGKSSTKRLHITPSTRSKQQEQEPQETAERNSAGEGRGSVEETQIATSISGVVEITKNFLDNLLQKVQSETREHRQLREPSAVKRHGRQQRQKPEEADEGRFEYRQLVRQQISRKRPVE